MFGSRYSLYKGQEDLSANFGDQEFNTKETPHTAACKALTDLVDDCISADVIQPTLNLVQLTREEIENEIIHGIRATLFIDDEDFIKNNNFFIEGLEELNAQLYHNPTSVVINIKDNDLALLNKVPAICKKIKNQLQIEKIKTPEDLLNYFTQKLDDRALKNTAKGFHSTPKTIRQLNEALKCRANIKDETQVKQLIDSLFSIMDKFNVKVLEAEVNDKKQNLASATNPDRALVVSEAYLDLMKALQSYYSKNQSTFTLPPTSAPITTAPITTASSSTTASASATASTSTASSSIATSTTTTATSIVPTAPSKDKVSNEDKINFLSWLRDEVNNAKWQGKGFSLLNARPRHIEKLKSKINFDDSINSDDKKINFEIEKTKVILNNITYQELFDELTNGGTSRKLDVTLVYLLIKLKLEQVSSTGTTPATFKKIAKALETMQTTERFTNLKEIAKQPIRHYIQQIIQQISDICPAALVAHTSTGENNLDLGMHTL